MQNTPTLCLYCVLVIVTQWLGQEFNSQQFWQISIKKFILIFGLNLQNTHALCLCCVFVIVTQWLGQEFHPQQFWQMPINNLFLILD